MGLLEGHQRWIVGDKRPVDKRFPPALEAVLMVRVGETSASYQIVSELVRANRDE